MILYGLAELYPPSLKKKQKKKQKTAASKNDFGRWKDTNLFIFSLMFDGTGWQPSCLEAV